MKTFLLYETVLPGDIGWGTVHKLKDYVDFHYSLLIYSETKSSSLSRKFFSVIEKTNEMDYHIKVFATDQVLIFIEKGTRPHRIFKSPPKRPVPVHGSFRHVTFRDIIRGKWKHPGTEGKHLFKRVWEDAKAKTVIAKET